MVISGTMRWTSTGGWVMGRPTDRHALDLDRDPVPGDPYGGRRAVVPDRSRPAGRPHQPGFAEELARRTLEFAREHEREMAASNPHMGAAEGFAAPDGFTVCPVSGRVGQPVSGR
jgi:hypothetical protein